MEITYNKGEKKNTVEVNIVFTLHYPADFNTGDENKPAIKLDLMKRLKAHVDRETNQSRINYEEFKIRNSNQKDLFE